VIRLFARCPLVVAGVFTAPPSRATTCTIWYRKAGRADVKEYRLLATAMAAAEARRQAGIPGGAEEKPRTVNYDGFDLLTGR
jgi:hypothetical protein